MSGKAGTRARVPVAIVHRSASFREGLAGAIDSTAFRVEEPEDLAEWLNGPAPRVVVVTEDGFDKLSSRPHGTLVVMLLAELDVGRYRKALAAGADGIAHVDSQPATIADIIRSSLVGEIVLPAEVARQLAGRPRPKALDLTPEEQGLLQRLSEGASIVQLADEFYLAERTVRRRLQNIYLELGATGRAEAVKMAGQLGLVD